MRDFISSIKYLVYLLMFLSTILTEVVGVEEQSLHIDDLIEHGRYSDALPLALSEKNRIKNEAGRKSDEMSDINYRLGIIYLEVGRINDAIDAVKESVSIEEDLYGTVNSTTLLLLGRAYYDNAQYSMALEIWGQVLRMRESLYGLSHPKVATVLNHIGLLYMALNRYDEAYASYERALYIHENMDDPDYHKIALIMLNIGLYYYRVSHITKSLGFNQRALKIYKKHGEGGVNRIPAVLNNIGINYMALGEYDKAHEVYREALDISKERLGMDHPELAMLLINIGDVYYFLSKPEERIDTYQEALRIYELWYGHDHPKVALALSGLADSLVRFEHYEQALYVAQESFAIYKKVYGRYHPYTNNALVGLGDIYRKKELYMDAINTYKRAYMMSADNDLSALNVIANRLCASFVSQNIGDLPVDHLRRNVFFCKKSLNILQKIRGLNTGIEKQYIDSFMRKHYNEYMGLVFVLLGMNRLSEAQQVIAMVREDEFANFNKAETMNASFLPLTYSQFDMYEKKWDEKIKSIKDGIHSLYNQIATIESIDPSRMTSIKLSELSDLKSRLLKAEELFLSTFNNMGLNFTTLNSHKIPIVTNTTKNLHNLLRAQEKIDNGKAILIQTFLVENMLAYLLTTSDGGLIREVTIIDQKSLRNDVQDLLDRLSNHNSDVTSVSSKLYDLVISPIENHLKGKTTIIWGHDGFLRYIPMSVLYDGKNFLVERFNMFRYTSAAHASINEHGNDKWMIQGFGVSKASKRFILNNQSIEYPALPAVLSELDSIVLETRNPSDRIGEITGEVFIDSGFTRESLINGLSKKPAVVHIASHFTLMDNIHDSHLLIGGDDEDKSNRLLSLNEIRRDVDLSGVDLLTLSACKTGQFETDKNGIEIEGLGVVAQEKGVKAVLATLWSVADQSTSKFMQNFYRLWNHNQLSKSEAVRAAQIGMIRGDMVPVHDKTTSRGWSLTRGIQSIVKPASQPEVSVNKYKHPYYWAPFILMGNGL